MARNPFSLEALDPGQRLCDREQELQDLLHHARQHTNVVLYAPRRTGKTSLARRVEHELQREGFVTVQVDFSKAASVDGVATRIAGDLMAALYRRESSLETITRYVKALKTLRISIGVSQTGDVSFAPQLDTSVPDPLRRFEQAMEEFATFVRRHDALRFFFIWDEFQEISRIKEAPQLERIIRAAIQGLPAAFFFLGSRRSVLRAMFEDERRMFFRSSQTMDLPPLPRPAMEQYLGAGLADLGYGEAEVPADLLAGMAEASRGYAYYLQHLGAELHRRLTAGERPGLAELPLLLARIRRSEEPIYRAFIQPLSATQLQVLKAVAAMPGAQVGSRDFVQQTGVPASTASYNLKYLAELDLVETREDGLHVVDPFFGQWLLE
ncbi:ATP-binding protein [Megalodesulfovibrio paquesii]